MSTAAELEKLIDEQGFRFFKGRELTEYWSRYRNGVTNSVPPKSLWKNIIPTLRVLDNLRAKLGASITINSTYRSPEYNRAIGGAPSSLHMAFKAIDFTCAKGTPKQWAEELTKMRNSGDFRGGIGVYPTFVHVDTRGTNADW